MSDGAQRQSPVAILAGGGKLPPLVTAAALRNGRAPVVFAIAGEAEPGAFAPAPVHVVRWGEIGRLFRLTEENGCREAVLIGSISQRPDYRTLRPDFGAMKLIPRILKLMTRPRRRPSRRRRADLRGEGPPRRQPARRRARPGACRRAARSAHVPQRARRDIEAADAAAREVGSRDIAQGAVAVGGQVVAVEDAAGTDALLERVALLRRAGAIARNGGVLVKCLKPQQDGRHDLPTIGPTTAEIAQRAGLAGVAAEAGRAILVGRDETIEAFRRAGLFLLGLKAADSAGHG